MHRCEGWDYGDEDVEGGVLEFDSRFELHVYKRRGESEPLAVWVTDDDWYVRPVELGRA